MSSHERRRKDGNRKKGVHITEASTVVVGWGGNFSNNYHYSDDDVTLQSDTLDTFHAQKSERVPIRLV